MEQQTFTTTITESILQDNLDFTLFPWSKQKGINPIAVKRAEGVYFFDYEGKRYLDFSSGLMNVNIGHGHQRITNAVFRQMRDVSYITPACASEARGELGKKLAEICPGNLNKAFFTLCGGTGIENAIKLARDYSGRHKIISRYQSYHGASYAALSAGGDPRKLTVDAQQAPNFIHIDIPHAYRYAHDEADMLDDAVGSLERMVAYEGPANIAAILLEGESGTSGCLQYPVGYLKEVRRICDEHGILLIMDEVMSGFGRTGKWFGFENHGIEPDIIVMAKGITSGYLPLGCVMVTDEIAAKYDHEMLPLGLTYTAHPVCCAAALENLKIYGDEKLLENTLAMSRYMDTQVNALMQRHPCIGDWRNTGLLGCIELVSNRQTKERLAPFNAQPGQMGLMNKVHAKLRELGLYTFLRWNFIFIAPPLCVTCDEIDEGLAMISEALLIADQFINQR